MLDLRSHLMAGHVIPALPLALTAERQWDQRHQRALIRYYLDAGAGGLAVGVHSTQFEIREPQHDLYRPLLALATTEIDCWNDERRPFLKIAGLCGGTSQACAEAQLAGDAGFHAGLLSMAAMNHRDETAVLEHCRIVAREFPLIGFYLQPAVGGRVFSYAFWRDFVEIPELVAVKVAAFNRYQTLDVVRAVLDSGRNDVALYTGNDDNIIVDLLTPFRHGDRTRFFDGGLLGQWGVWTRSAVRLLQALKHDRATGHLDLQWLTRAAELTDANAAVFDAAHGFAGCLPGIHEVLRRQGLLQTTVCLNPHEQLSPGQATEIDRVGREHAWLADDDAFIRAHLERWLN